LIISRLNGGLGNQMFQYALGRSLALKHNTNLGLDISSYHLGGGVTQRKFALDDFTIDSETVDLSDHKPNDGITQYLQRFYPYYRRNEIQERTFNFDPNILKASRECILTGYWQSEKYFKEAESVIRRDFSFKKLVYLHLEKTSSDIENSHSVSIHFRRGDYVENEQVNKIHGVCDFDYYMGALKILNAKYSDLKLFVFSDDIQWVMTNFEIGQEIDFIDTGSDTSDMYLMSLCKHHIIANSSFSWWGAWLGRFSDKTVIAPKSWFKTTARKTDDLLPPSWIRI